MQNKEDQDSLDYAVGGPPPSSVDNGVRQAPLNPDALSQLPGEISIMSDEESNSRRPVVRFSHFVKRTNILLILLLMLAGFGILLVSVLRNMNERSANSAALSSEFESVEIPLGALIEGKNLDIAEAASVTINGAMQLNGEIAIAPSLQPTGAKAGQIYYDQGTNQLAYFNGEVFVFLTGSDSSAGGVQSLGGATGEVVLGGGLVMTDGRLSNTGVLSVQGLNGDVSLTAGAGLLINGTTFSNTGVLSVTAGTPNVQIEDDGEGNMTISVVGSGTGTLASSGGTTGTIPVFTASQNVEDSIITQSGLNIAIAGSLSLDDALEVTSGGTGTASLAANGVLIGNGAGAVGSVVAGSAGLCLVSTSGVPVWAACPGAGGGVTSLNGLTGGLVIANTTGAGSTITIDDASTTGKGIASFSSTNFIVTSGAVNTIQDINTGATPTFTGLNTNTITPTTTLSVVGNVDVSGTLSVGSADAFQVAANGTFTTIGSGVLQGGSLTLGTTSTPGTIIVSDGSNNTGTLQTAPLGQNTVYTLPDPGVGAVTICLTTGNCSGAGGGVSTNGGTINRLAKFTGGQAIGDASISDDGTNVTALVDMIIQGGDLTLGTTSQNASMVLHDGNGQTTTLQAGNSAGDLTFILPTNAGAANQCLKQSGAGNQLVWQDCDGGAGGSSATLQVAYNNSTDPEIIVDTIRGGLTVRDALAPIGSPLFNVQNNNGSITYFGVTAGGVSVVGTASVSGNINTVAGSIQTNGTSRIDTGGNLVNIGNLTGAGTITIASAGGGNDVIINGADQFIVQDSSVFNALSTFNANIDIGANDIVGTTADIDLTNFDVTGATGNVTAGTYNGQTISNTASFTGTVAVAGNTTVAGDIAVNGGDITSSGALNITPGGTLTVGANNQTLTLQGGAATSLRATNGANTTTVAFASPTANTTLNFPALAAGTYTICTTSGNCSGAAATLQSAYDNSSTPEIVLDATRGGLTIRDNASALGANLLEVQDNAGAVTYLGVTVSGIAVTGTATVSGNINTTGGAIQTNGTARIDNAGNLVNIAAITASGNATLQGGSMTLGTISQAGSIIVSDGSNNTGTLQTAPLGQNTVYTLPDPGTGAATICLTSGNCSGVGGGVTTAGGTTNRLAKFNAAQSIEDSSITDDGTNVTAAIDVIIQGGDLTIGSTSQAASIVLNDGNGQTTTLQAGNSAGNLTFILPTNTGVANQCLKQSGAGNQLVWQDCDGGAGGSSATLQTVYDNSTTPEITLNSSVGGLTIRDNSTPLGANLLEIQNNLGDTTYLAVTVSGLNITGTTTSSGNINSTGGAIQTGNTSRIDNAGNLVNIGNITGAGAITIASVGAGSDITVNGADQFIVQDSSVFNALSTFNANINIGANDIIGTTADIDLTNFDVVGSTGNVTAGTYNGQTISNTASFTGTVAVAGNTALTGDIAVNGGDITSAGALNITPGGTLTVGVTGQQLILQGNASTRLSATGGGFTTNLGFAGTPTGDVTYNLDRAAAAGTYTICTTVGNCIGAGGGVTTTGGTTGTLSKFTGAQTLGDSLLSESGSTVTVNGNLNLISGNQYQVNGVQISSANLSNDANLAKLNASQTFTGNAVAFQNATNSTNAFNIQNQTGGRILTVNTSAGQVVLGTGGSLGGALVFGNATNTNTVTIVPGTPTANRTLTLPDASGIICTDSGNCANAGGGVTTAGGTANRLPVFNGTQTLANSWLNQNASTIEIDTTRNLSLLGGNLSVIGTGTFSSTFNANANVALGDADTDTVTITGVLQGGSPLVFEGVGADANELTLSIATLTADRTVTLPDETGTVCLQSSASCNFAVATGSGSYIQNQNASAQPTSNFWISGTGRAVTLQAATLDTGTAGALALGTTNATAINLNQDTTIASGKSLTVSSGPTVLTGANTGDALTVSNASSTDNIAVFKDGSQSVFVIKDGGEVKINTLTSTSTAFVIANANDDTLFSTDTFNNSVRLRTIGRNNTSTFDAIWLQGSKNGITALIGGNDDTSTYTAADFSGSMRFNGSGIGWGDFAFFPTGNGDGNNGAFRFSTTGSALNTTPNAKIGVGDLFVNGKAGIGTNNPAYPLHVVGDINISSGSSFRINGTAICAATGCTASSSSAILNQTAGAQAAAGFWISGTGRSNTGFTAPYLDAPINDALSLGAGVASSVTIGNATYNSVITLNSGTSAINIGTGAQARTVNVATGAANQTLTIGSLTGSSITTIRAGSGGISLTANTNTGGVNVKSNTNSTGAFKVLNASDIEMLTVDTSSDRVYIGNLLSDTTGALLILDTKNNSGDPTGVNGGMYYNSSLAKFRCYEDSAWVNCTSGLNDAVTVSDVDVGLVTTSSQTFTMTATINGTTFIAPPSGKVLINWNAESWNSAASTQVASIAVRMGPFLGSGTSVLAPSDEYAYRPDVGTARQQGGRSKLITDLNPGGTFNAVMEVRAGANTANFERREIIVQPVW